MQKHSSRAVFRVAVAAGLFGFGLRVSADIPASAYVQNGLITQWDGIDNAGTGSHDASATVWKDLKGSLDLTLTSRGSWVNGAALSVNRGCAAKAGSATAAYKSIEVVYKMTTNDGRILFDSGCTTGGSRRWVLFDNAADYSELYVDGADNQIFARVVIETDKVKSFSAVYDDKNIVSAVATNGLFIANPSKQSNDWGIGDGKAMIGERYANTVQYPWTGEVYAIRLYDRVLTADDLWRNALIDRARFEGADPDELLREGFRWNGSKNCVEMLLTVKGASGATVSLDNVSFDATTSGWFPLDETVTVYAKPAEGQKIVGWQGLPDGAEVSSDQMSVSFRVNVPMALTAVGSVDVFASAYVQKGLIAQWDGVENVGAGLHDPDATVWKNLVTGTSFNWTLVSGNYIWEDDAVNAKSSLSTTGWLATMTGVKSIDYTTFETYVHPEAGLAKTTGSFFRQATRKGNVFLMPGNVSGYLTSGQTGANLGFKLGDRFSTTLVYNSDGSAMSAVYKDGVAQTLTTPTYGWSVRNQDMSIGGISATDTDYVFKGRIHAIRLYNRQLTADEVAYNANIDKIRFENAVPSELTWPDDYRWNDGKRCVEVRLTVVGENGATVSLDNETFVASTNALFALGSSMTVYSKPADGQYVAAWTGLPEGAQASGGKSSVTFVMNGVLSVAAVSHVPVTLRWRGGASAFASDAANWVKDGGGAAAMPPVDGDAVCFDKDSPSMTWDIDDITLASWTQDADFKGTNTFLTGPVLEGEAAQTHHGVLSADGKRYELIVTGDITLNGGAWTHQATPSLASDDPRWISGEGVYRLIARAGGDFIIGENAHVSADDAGFRSRQGPGFINKDRAACHGGTAFAYSPGHDSFRTNVYGLVRTPVAQGSGGGDVNSHGGGAIELSATGSIALNGKVSACSTKWIAYYTGSGGSIYLKASQLTGAGSVDANGFGWKAGAGAGGRIAFILTGAGATLDGFTGKVLCDGNTNSCHPGTIYKETPSDRDEGGVLEIVGTGVLDTGYRGNYTVMMPNGEDFTFKRIVLTNKVMFAVGPGATVKTGELKSYSTENNVVLAGGRLVVPDGFAFTNVTMKNEFNASQIGTPEGVTGTNLLAKGVTFTINRRIDFDGTFRMLSGSKITHTAADTTDSSQFRADFTTGDGFVLDDGASVDLASRGYPASAGPGKPIDDGKTSRGGSHGGLAHDVGSVKTYGSITRPTTLGSGGARGSGGGATHIAVKGRSVIDGTIKTYGTSWEAGASGSIWIETGTLEGASTGVISADGGSGGGGEFFSGAGGRVAVTLTEPGADFSLYKGKISANGVTSKASGKLYASGAGTVYLRKGGEQENEGTLVIDGIASCANDDNYTDISMDVTENTVGHVVVTNGGILRVRKGATLNVRESFANKSIHQDDRANGEPSDGVLAAGTVAFVDKTVAATVTGTNTFMCLKCAEPGKTVRFGAASDTYTKIDALGSFEVAGTQGSPVFLRGLTDATPWLLELRGKANVAYADVKDSDARSGDKVSVDDTNVDSGNNYNWGFVSITPGETITWTGTKGAAWGTADNWDLGRAPVDTDVIVIPANAEAVPELTEPLVANTITVEQGATLRLNAFSLTVTNGLACAGEIACSATETLTLAGDVTIKDFTAADSTVVLAGEKSRTVDFGGVSLKNLEITGTAVQTTFADGFSADFITCIRTDAASTIVFAAGETVTVGQIKLRGALSDVLPGMTLASSEPDTRWKLNVTGKADVAGVIVTDSDASAGKRVAAFDPSEDGKNNVNWLFGVTQSAWIGPAAGGNWSDAANWADGKIPDKDTRVVFDQDATVTIDTSDAVVMQLEVENATLTVKGTETLRVTTLLDVGAGGTLTQDTAGNCIHVEGSVYVRKDGVWTHAANGTANTDQGFGVNATVDGDLTIDAGGKVEGNMKGFGNKLGWGGQQRASHGARRTVDAKASYGSMFRPTDLGSGGDTAGGGRISLVAKGTLTANGSIEVDAQGTEWYPGSAGSILLKCGRLAGSGVIRAQGGSLSKGFNEAGDAGCGGRVAVYLTESTNLSDFFGSGGTIQAYGGVKSSLVGALPLSPCGTVYLQPMGVEDGCGTVLIHNGGGAMTTGGVDLPVTNRCDDVVKSYSTVTFDVAEGGTLFLTGDVTVKELELGAKSRINLNGHTLTIKSHAHKKGKGWPANWETAVVYPGTNADGNPGKIVWEPWGMMIFVK